MDAAKIELKLALDEVGLPDCTLQSFSERLNVQKRIYLVQALGYDLGYRFSWYLRGPYSRVLTEDAFTVRDALQAGDSDAESFILADIAKEKITVAKELWELPAESNLGVDQWLELLASLHYLKEVAYWPSDANKSFDAVFDKLVESKPQFGNHRDSASQAWDRLASFQLIKAESAA